jgi:phenylalanyl-tRNA synthetase beta chain
MRAPLSWLRELVDIPTNQTARDIADRLVHAGLEVESVEEVGAGLRGDLIVGRVQQVEVLTDFKKPIRWCQVDVGAHHGGVRGIICGASNFAEGDLVVVAVPGTTLPGNFTITARETYGHTSDGMICSEREMGLGNDHDGIVVLPPGAAAPGDDAKPILGIGDAVLDIAITPDRGYALSMRGIAREVAIAYGVPFDDPAERALTLPPPSKDHAPAECGSEDLDACPLFTLSTLIGFDPHAQTPRWMAQRLTACGMRPVSLAVDITNYVMLELGQPLHAFDLAKLRGPVRPARVADGTPFETLDHVVRTLTDDDLVIRDDTGPIGLAGVMGGLTSEVEDDTTAIALEAAWFRPDVIARASRRHKISSEASRRYERGVDRALAPIASARAMALMLELGGGTYCGMTGVEDPFTPTLITMSATEPADVAGMPIDAATVEHHLAAVGCTVLNTAGTLQVTAPTWRPDLRDPADLVEEVVRLVGYDTLPATLPTAALGHGLTTAQRIRRRVGTILAARGMVEVLSYPFVGDAECDALRLPADDVRRVTPRLANPLSDEQPFLRGSLIPSLVAAAQRNLGRGATDLRIFEIGKVFRGNLGENPGRIGVQQRPSDAQWRSLNDMLPAQPTHVAVLLAGDRCPPGWWGGAPQADWADAIEVSRAIAASLGLDLIVDAGDDPMLHPGRAAVLRVGAHVVGSAGELHPSAVEAAGLPAHTAIAELDLDLLVDVAPTVRPAPAMSAHPVAKEDIALVVGPEVTVAQVEQAIRAGAGDLLEEVRLFDIYQGPQIPEGHRSLAFALRLRAPDRTLTAEEITRAREAALASAAAACGAVLR